MSSHEPGDVPMLSRSHFAIILAAVVVFFLVGMGPIWLEPFDYDRLAPSIIWSYAPIPVLVLVFLSISRRLTVRSWFLGTVVVAATKFAVTASIMIVIWSLSGPPPPHSSMSRSRLIAFAAAPAVPPPPPVDASETGRVSGRVVVDVAGGPVPGTLVWLETVPERTHPQRRDVIVLTNEGAGPRPAIAAVQAGQPLVLRSLDGRSHALMGVLPDGTSGFNHAMIPAGADRAVVLPLALGRVVVRCTIHPAEAPGRLAVLPHPFFAATGVDGTYAFDGVPAGDITIAAAIDGVIRTTRVRLAAGAEVTGDFVGDPQG